MCPSVGKLSTSSFMGFCGAFITQTRLLKSLAIDDPADLQLLSPPQRSGCRAESSSPLIPGRSFWPAAHTLKLCGPITSYCVSAPETLCPLWRSQGCSDLWQEPGAGIECRTNSVVRLCFGAPCGMGMKLDSGQDHILARPSPLPHLAFFTFSWVSPRAHPG